MLAGKFACMLDDIYRSKDWCVVFFNGDVLVYQRVNDGSVEAGKGERNENVNFIVVSSGDNPWLQRPRGSREEKLGSLLTWE